jgi:hypothetical protein
MSDDASQTADTRESPGGRPMGAWWIAGIALYLVVIAVIVVHGLVVLWPANGQPGRNAPPATRTTATAPAGPAPTATPAPAVRPAPARRPSTPARPASASTSSSRQIGSMAVCRGDQEGQASASIFGQQLCLSPEERMFWIVLLCGLLGGLVHSLRSFAWYVGNRELVRSWAAFYVTLPVVGGAMALIFYLVIRGGFFPQAQVSETSPFGFAALAVLIGMFTEEAAVKLKSVAATLLTAPEKGKDQAPAMPTLTQVIPRSGSVAGGTPVTITGTAFDAAARVSFGGKMATRIAVPNSTTITAETPPGEVAGAVVAVEVVNPGDLKGTLPNGFTYTA